ncbi:MAG: phenylalanine--tRNA ligase subunit beta [Candidatus Parvarchaeota archaeon]
MISTNREEMNAILGMKLSSEEYSNLSFRYGLDLDINEDTINFETTSDRAELISKYGLARLLSQLKGKRMKTHDIEAKSLPVYIERTDRPFVNCLLLRLDREVGDKLKDLIEIQNKVDLVIGRKRRQAAIGLFDYDKIRFPIRYKTKDKGDIKFIPLGYAEEKTYTEIMNGTEAGMEYGNIAPDKPIVWEMDDGKVMALPPIINADAYSISRQTKNIFIDITGRSKKAVNSATKALIFNLAVIGGVTVIKTRLESKGIDTEFDLSARRFLLKHEFVEELVGESLDHNTVSALLKDADYGVKFDRGIYAIDVPFYRDDVINQTDIVDDFLRFYGISNLKPAPITTYTTGGKLKETEYSELISDRFVGLGYQELDSNVLTNEAFQFDRTGLKRENYAKLSESKSLEISMARKLLFPEILRFISSNLNRKFPQKLFDIGYVVEFDQASDTSFSNKLHLSAVYSGLDANFSDVKAAVKVVLYDIFDVKDLKISEDDGFKDTFIDGRHGRILCDGKDVGFIGEVHPRVLNGFNINFPTTLAEIYLDELLEG